MEEPVTPRTATRYTDAEAQEILNRAAQLETAVAPLARPAATLYTDEEAQEILSRAMGLRDQGMTRDSLVRMADELGISPEELARAEAEYRSGSVTARERAEFLAIQRRDLRIHAMSYVLVVSFLFLFFGFIAFFVAQELAVLTPAIITMLGWGLGLAFHIMYYMNVRSNPEGNEEFEKWQEKERRRLERRERRRLRR